MIKTVMHFMEESHWLLAITVWLVVTLMRDRFYVEVFSVVPATGGRQQVTDNRKQATIHEW
jgi:hypothetical protein